MLPAGPTALDTRSEDRDLQVSLSEMRNLYGTDNGCIPRCRSGRCSVRLIPSEDVLIVPFCFEHPKSLSILSVGLKPSIKSNWFD